MCALFLLSIRCHENTSFTCSIWGHSNSYTQWNFLKFRHSSNVLVTGLTLGIQYQGFVQISHLIVAHKNLQMVTPQPRSTHSWSHTQTHIFFMNSPLVWAFHSIGSIISSLDLLVRKKYFQWYTTFIEHFLTSMMHLISYLYSLSFM